MTTKSRRSVAMKVREERSTFLIAFFVGIASVAGSYASAGYTQAFIASPITSFLAWGMPDVVLRFAIVVLTGVGEHIGIEHLGQQANLLLALVFSTVLLASLVVPMLLIGRELNSTAASVVLAGSVTWLAITILTGAPGAAVGAGLASAFVVAVGALIAGFETAPDSTSTARRQVLGSVAAALGVGILGYMLGDGKSPQSTPEPASLRGSDEKIQELLAIADKRSLDVAGLKGLVSGDGFYEVDINNVNPAVDVSEWTLTVTGNVEQEVTYSYDDILSMDREYRFSTLRCVSDTLNGGEMDNDLWTGVPIMDLIDEANPQGEFVMLRAVDDYYEEFAVEALRDGFLAYGKNDGVLPRGHGYPARALIPGHWGEISVKWINEIQILDGPEKGFWEKRGWHGTGPVNTIAKLHAVNHLDNGKIQVGGHAYAGTRGIERVEVSVSGDDAWNTATLSEKLPAGTSTAGSKPPVRNAWRQWEFTYNPPSGEHTVTVRAVDGSGALQPQKQSDSPYPKGSTGWVTRTITP
ncbi:molybdopterin-dependent oxidoreductase [Halocatena marina]|uniref:Molybdopterin-dependent oxidoreductase n=1 Tax=Halocatena marina TaxID=2934937 RepID=A0ABD5YKF0_9EURY